MKIPIDKIKIEKVSGWERQRSEIGESDFQTLIFSMDVRGLINPITVTEGENGNYELLAGERRLKAAKHLKWEEIEVTLLDDLSEVEREEVELEENIRRTNLPWQDQARAIERLMFLRKQENRFNKLDSFTGGFTQGDLAKEYGFSPAKFSQDLKLARALREFPDLAKVKRRVDALKTIRRMKAEENRMPEALLLEKLKGVFVFDDKPLKFLEELQKHSLDLIIIDTEASIEWRELTKNCGKKLTPYGFGFVFCTFETYGLVTNLLEEMEYIYLDQPLIWQNKDVVRPCVWFSKHAENEPDKMKKLVMYESPNKAVHETTKSTGLFAEYVRALSQVNGTVFAPDCYSPGLVTHCFDIKRKIIALCPNEVLLQKIYANLTMKEEK